MQLRRRISVISEKSLYIIIILIPFAASFSSAAVNTLIGLAIVAYLLKKIINKERYLIATPINIPFLLLILIAAVSIFNSVSLKASIHGIIKLLKYGFIFIIISEQLKDKTHLKRIIIALISGVYLATLDGFYQLCFGYDLLRHKPADFVIGLFRVKAAFPHTNIFAGYLALFVPVSIALALYYFKGKRKLLLGVVSVSVLYCLILTFSRSAVLGGFIAVLFTAIVKRDKLILAILVLTVLAAPFLLPQSIRDWAKSTDSVWELLLNKARLNIYKTSLNMVRAHPFIGVGVNTFCLNYEKYKIHETEEFTGPGYYAHNIYLHTAGEIGVIGLLIFLWTLFALFREWVKSYKHIKDNFLKVCSLGIVAGIIAFLINGLTETNLYYPKIAVLFWFQIGLLLGILKIKAGRFLEGLNR